MRYSIVVVALVVVAGAGAALAGAADPAASMPIPALAAQTEPSAAEQLNLGQRFDAGAWDVEVQDLITAPSERFAYTAVRVAVAVGNDSAGSLLFSQMALSGENNYPVIQVRDQADNVYAIDRTTPLLSSVNGSNLITQPPGVPARWTLGFEVPTDFSDQMSVELVVDSVVVAAWDVNSQLQASAGWAVPQAADSLTWGESVAWLQSEGDTTLSVEPIAMRVDVCGDPEAEHVPVSFSLAMDVTNTGRTDQLWPGVRHPHTPGVAVWADGGSGRVAGLVSGESHVEDTTIEGDEEEPLVLRNEEQVRIPPQRSVLRSLSFVTPRDGRFVDVNDLPAAVVFFPPDADPVWFDLTGNPPLTFAYAETCDELAGSAPFVVGASS